MGRALLQFVDIQGPSQRKTFKKNIESACTPETAPIFSNFVNMGCQFFRLNDVIIIIIIIIIVISAHKSDLSNPWSQTLCDMYFFETMFFYP